MGLFGESTADALDAGVVVEEAAPASVEVSAVEDDRVALEAAVASARRKVEKQRAHLKEAEQYLADAEAALREGV